MNNLKTLSNLCTAIVNTFYPDNSVLEMMLFNEGIDAQADAQPKDEKLFRIAVQLVIGYVEGSRSENGISTSVRDDAVKDSIKYWCNIYGLDVEDVLDDSVRVIEDGSSLW